MTDAMYHGRKDETEVGARTIALSDRDLSDAIRLLSLLLDQQGPTGETLGSAGYEGRQTLVERARRTLFNRRRRSGYFPTSMFGEPAWEMLLVLYASERSGARLTIARLTEQCGASPSTGLRWIDYLEQGQFVYRQANPIDQRTVFIKLSDKARGALDGYFSGITNTSHREITDDR